MAVSTSEWLRPPPSPVAASASKWVRLPPSALVAIDNHPPMPATRSPSPMPKSSFPRARDTDALLREVVRLFVQAQRTMTACCSDASAKECEGLLLVGQHGPITVQDFARRMALEKTWASRLLTRLERKRYVRRLDHPTDGRSWLLELTPAGRKEQAKLQAGLNEHASNLLDCVPAGQRAAVEQALVTLRDALRECLVRCGPGGSSSC